ncbi:hypothetical protein GQ42DRAFT_118741 [Ramicandelaber brevisporus]|nr:hypothetical protein GQ42DRAFT_118741 [Ramicandelaber brevisporus]
MGDYSPQARIAILFHLSLSVGMLSGGIPALQLRGYQYLAENAHQLPRTKRGWFMYHRQKNYEAMMAFFIGGAKSAVRIMLPVLAFEATTTAIDWLRTTGASYTQIEADAAKENKTSGQVDALGRVMAGAVVGSVFATQTRLTKGSARRVMRLGIGIGLGMGLLEDAIAYFSGYPPAYLQSLLNHSERISSF